jgi:hypothetical protein
MDILKSLIQPESYRKKVVLPTVAGNCFWAPSRILTQNGLPIGKSMHLKKRNQLWVSVVHE